MSAVPWEEGRRKERERSAETSHVGICIYVYMSRGVSRKEPLLGVRGARWLVEQKQCRPVRVYRGDGIQGRSDGLRVPIRDGSFGLLIQRDLGR